MKNKYYKNINKCRICDNTELTEVLSFPAQFLSPTFVKTNEDNELSKVKVPLTLLLCNKENNKKACGLIQLKETVFPEYLYTNYFYRTSTNSMMKKDLGELVKEAKSKSFLLPNDVVIDIGANDMTMISYFPEQCYRIGVEPAKNIKWDNVDKSIKIVNDYFSAEAIQNVCSKKAHLITSCAMFYDLDDPNSFVKDIKKVLDKNGVWCIQLSYLGLMLKNLNFYDICHEHLQYYSLEVLENLMQKNGLTIFDASLNGVNGGSARVYITHEESRTKSYNYLKLLKEEKEMNLDSKQVYVDFNNKISELKKKVLEEIRKQKGNEVLALGASTKGNVLLQTFGIDKTLIEKISERNPEKVGLKTLGTDLKLISEQDAHKINPAFMIILPWYFKSEIVKREKSYIENGGRLLFPMPYAHYVTKDGEIRL